MLNKDFIRKVLTVSEEDWESANDMLGEKLCGPLMLDGEEYEVIAVKLDADGVEIGFGARARVIIQKDSWSVKTADMTQEVFNVYVKEKTRGVSRVVIGAHDNGGGGVGEPEGNAEGGVVEFDSDAGAADGGD